MIVDLLDYSYTQESSVCAGVRVVAGVALSDLGMAV